MTTVTLRRTALLDAMQDSYSHSSTSMNRGRPLLRKVATCITLFCLCIPSCSHELTFLLCSNFGSGVVNRKFGKMSDSKQSRHPVRVRNVRILRRVASEHGVAAVPDNAARKRVEKLGEDLLAVQLEESDAQAVRQALKDYQATFRTAEVSGEAQEPKRAERSEADENQREWKFSAVQLTYNGSHGGFVATDIGQLQDLFSRFTAFLNGLKLVLHAVGISATMERASVERVHLHAYLHLSKLFRKSGREALAAFVFEGIRPHVEPNRAHGNAFQGAVKFGHFYVFCDKKGSLCLG